MDSTSIPNVLLIGSENVFATELPNSSVVFLPCTLSPPIGSVQVGPENQAVTEAANQEGHQVDGWDDGEGGRPVAIVAVEEGSGRRGGGGEEVGV